jgi:hypothetical protein
LAEKKPPNADSGDDEAQILKVMKYGYTRDQAVQIHEKQKIDNSNRLVC